MSVRIIISRFHEDVGWIDDLIKLIPDIKISLYNRGKTLGVHNEIMVQKNIGRESFIFFNHIIENYDRLSDINIFCQGHPFDHCPDFIDRVASAVRDSPLPVDRLFKGPRNTVWPTFRDNHRDRLPFVILKSPYTVEKRSDRWSNPRRRWYGIPTKNHYDKTWKKIFQGTECPQEMNVFNCQFIVSGDRIRARNIELYKTYRSILATHSAKEFEAWKVERFWDIIFDGITEDRF